MKFVESGQSLGARVEDLDLSKPLSDEEFKQLEQALGKYGVLSYPKQNLTSLQLKDFAERFGRLEINVANLYQEPGLPEVMILSNKVENGKPVGLSHAGRTGVLTCRTAK